MPRWPGSLSDEKVRELAEDVEAGRASVRSLAREVGMTPWALGKRMHGLELLTDERPTARHARQKIRLVFRATCPCGQSLQASQLGDSSDAGWMAWHRRAVHHARTHGIDEMHVLRWVDDLWESHGVRELTLDGP